MTVTDIASLHGRQVQYRTGEISNNIHCMQEGWNNATLTTVTRQTDLPGRYRNSTPLWHKGDPAAFTLTGTDIILNPRDFNEQTGLFVMEEYLFEIRPLPQPST